MRPSLKKGFSIIELIFVIAVLGIIAAVAVPKLMDSRNSALVTTIKQDISTITTSIQSYYMINNKIEKITDSVNINPSTWKVSDLQVEYISEDNTCIDILIKENQLDLIIDETSSEICQKIYDSGIRDATYELY
ncbi:MAG: general secretion pathway protein G [Arcobacteraceae bacterium]|jgi:general secretion pathway protein G